MNAKFKRNKALLLLSSGIDSPVAGYLLKEQGTDLIPVHFDHYPLRQTKELKIDKLCKKLNFKNYYLVPYGNLQIEIIKKCNPRYRCVLCRRFMFKIAEKLAEKEKADYLATGENLGQVASQVLENMVNTDKSIKLIILRPLLCRDKQEVINIAKKIGTFEISITQNSCCGAVPQCPITKSKLNIILQEEEKLDVEKLVKEAVKNASLHRI
ncbi:hypothetical protein J4403_04335 [Candidatus Woesearchaeota archaeon]|nr:hypothetical protein [Candidatus Woesearchaeota archaeon]